MDTLQRFLFENLSIRGELVKLDATWQAILERHDYPQVVRNLLGEMMVAASLLSATLKFSGKMIIQIQGGHPLTLMVVECDSERHLRAIAHYDDDLDSNNIASLADLIGDGHLMISLQQSESNSKQRYQSIVDISSKTLAETICDYLLRYEQLDTRLWLVCNEQYAAGLLIQKLPDSAETNDQDGWNRILQLSNTVTNHELLSISDEQIIHRLYHEEDVRVFEKEPVSFRCSCSRDGVTNMLRSLGSGEVNDIIKQEHSVRVICEFCNQKYEFDVVDVEQLFASGITHDTSTTRH